MEEAVVLVEAVVVDHAEETVVVVIEVGIIEVAEVSVIVKALKIVIAAEEEKELEVSKI